MTVDQVKVGLYAVKVCSGRSTEAMHEYLQIHQEFGWDGGYEAGCGMYYFDGFVVYLRGTVYDFYGEPI